MPGSRMQAEWSFAGAGDKRPADRSLRGQGRDLRLDHLFAACFAVALVGLPLALIFLAVFMQSPRLVGPYRTLAPSPYRLTGQFLPEEKAGVERVLARMESFSAQAFFANDLNANKPRALATWLEHFLSSQPIYNGAAVYRSGLVAPLALVTAPSDPDGRRAAVARSLRVYAAGGGPPDSRSRVRAAADSAGPAARDRAGPGTGDDAGPASGLASGPASAEERGFLVLFRSPIEDSKGKPIGLMVAAAPRAAFVPVRPKTAPSPAAEPGTSITSAPGYRVKTPAFSAVLLLLALLAAVIVLQSTRYAYGLVFVLLTEDAVARMRARRAIDAAALEEVVELESVPGEAPSEAAPEEAVPEEVSEGGKVLQFPLPPEKKTPAAQESGEEARQRKAA